MKTKDKLDNLLDDICNQFGLSKDQITSERRFPVLVLARYEFTKRASEITDDKEIIAKHINRERTICYHYMNDYQPIEFSSR